MGDETLYEHAGGDDAFLRLARAFHARCLADPVLEHPFSHEGHPQHVERLGAYWAEVLGGPAWYSEQAGGHDAMLAIHAHTGAEDDLPARFLACFVAAMDDAHLPADPGFREAMRAYMGWATADVHAYSPSGVPLPTGQVMPRWGWHGLERAPRPD